MGLSSFFQDRLRQWKGLFKLHFQYPGRFPGSRIDAVLPANAEALIGTGTAVEAGARISPHLRELGHHFYLGRNAWISWCSRIGNYCSISHDTNIGLLNHALDHVGTSPVFYEKRKGWVEADTFDPLKDGMVEIGHDVLISAKAIVLSGVKIGTGAVIAAGSVVNRDVPPYAIVGGIPARVIKYRFEEEVIARLLASQWWAKPEAELKKLAPYFSRPEEFLAKLEAEG